MGDLAHAISALFLGIELLNRLDGDSSRTDSLFASLAGAASLAGSFLSASDFNDESYQKLIDE